MVKNLGGNFCVIFSETKGMPNKYMLCIISGWVERVGTEKEEENEGGCKEVSCNGGAKREEEGKEGV